MEQKHMFSNADLRRILLPLILEQLLNSLMGTVDTIMVSNVGSAAISSVSLVDSINILIIQAFSALAAGGSIICAQYMGSRDIKKANHAARQMLYVVTLISVGIMAACLLFRNPLLRLIFGQVEADVMKNSQVYFLITSLSFPFIALYNAGASTFRAQQNTKGPMLISVASNFINIGGNALLIYVFHMGVAGAALATLASRTFCAVVVLWRLAHVKQPNEERRFGQGASEGESQPIIVRDYLQIRPDGAMIKRILSIGIPAGIENGMFQFGKLAIQSTVSTLGTVSIAAQAMTNILEGLNGMAGIGVGIGLMTIVGECLGADRKEEATYYIRKLLLIGEGVIVLSCAVVFALTKPITIIGGMESASASLCFQMMFWITVVKPFFWVFAFIIPYGLRAAGDVKFTMLTSCTIMWVVRVALCIFLIRVLHMETMAVWIAMFADWIMRAVLYGCRFLSGKWAEHNVLG